MTKEENEPRFFNVAASTVGLRVEQHIQIDANEKGSGFDPAALRVNQEMDGYRCGPSYGSTFRKSERMARSSGVNIFW